MGLIGGLFKKDTRSLTRQVRDLVDTLLINKKDAEAIAAVPNGRAGGIVKLTMTGKYLINGKGSSQIAGDVKLSPSDLADAIGVEAGAGVDSTREVETDGDRNFKIDVTFWSNYGAGQVGQDLVLPGVAPQPTA